MNTIKFLTGCLLCFVILFTACEKEKIETSLTTNADVELRNGGSSDGNSDNDPNSDPNDLDFNSGNGPTNNLLNPDNNDCDVDELDLRILFVGNSFMTDYTTDIPAMFQDLAEHNNQSISTITTSAISGHYLSDHLNGNTANLINQGNWDYIILQENFGWLTASTPSSGVNAAFTNVIQAYVNLIGSSTKIVLFQPVPPVAIGTDYDDAQSALNILFRNTASIHQNVFVANIGESFQKAYAGEWTFNPNPESLRYGPTYQYHFRNAGGFLAAVHFYSMIFGNKPCIPTNMHFYDQFGPVSQYVPQYHALAQIGYIYVPYVIHGFPTSSECQINQTIFGYPGCN